MAKLKILFITDSLAFPRPDPEPVVYEETYIALLKAEFPECDFIHHGRGGATIVDLFKHSTYYHAMLRPDVVFMHAGVVDCAPRALTVIEQQVVARVPWFSGPLTALVKKYSAALRQVRHMTYTPVAVFAHYVSLFDELFQNVYWIDILPASDAYESKLRGIQKNAGIYSAVLRQHRHIDTSYFEPADIMSDFHHLNPKGHHRLFAALSPVIRREIEGRGGAPQQGA